MGATENSTIPVQQPVIQTAPRLTLDPFVKAPDGSFYAHKDYQRVVEPWAVEQHVPPVKAEESFGDVESFVAYVKRYDDETGSTFLTWNEQGLRAVLDYHLGEAEPGRAQWTARHPFLLSDRWQRWARLTSGTPMSQGAAVESLEDLAEDIVDPDAAGVIEILRKLRATVKSEGSSELEPTGNTSISFKKDAQIISVTVPSEIKISIPVLKGHVRAAPDGTIELDAAGRPIPVLYTIGVRIRPTVADDSKISFRFGMPTAERAKEMAYADQVSRAEELLGDAFQLLRA